MTVRPNTGLVSGVLIRGYGSDELRLAPIHGGEERGEDGHIIVLDRRVDAAIAGGDGDKHNNLSNKEGNQS